MGQSKQHYQFVASRREMAQLLDDRMNRSYTTLAKQQELEVDTSLVKTYLLEAHTVNDGTHSVSDFLRRAFADVARSYHSSAEYRSSKDGDLHCVGFRSGDEHITLYLDTSDTRFWLLHSMNSSEKLDHALQHLLRGNEGLDVAWLWVELLEHIAEQGSFRGMGLDFDGRYLTRASDDEENSSLDFLKMQLWGTKAAEVLSLLRHKRAFPGATVLSKVKVKYWGTPKNDRHFTVDDVKFNGKITARGTSFQCHSELVNRFYKLYKERVKGIEEKHSISWQRTNGRTTLLGEPITIELPKPPDDLSAFCEALFSSSPPFRLWGLPMRETSKLVRVSAVDLHIGSRLDFEISNMFIRVYLPKGSCGNSIVRLYTNLQHYYDARSVAVDGDRRRVFEL